MILMLDNYDSFTYNLVQELEEISGVRVHVVRNDEMSVQELLNLKPSAIVISPGPGRPAEAGISEDLIRAAGDTPLLGICLGFQALAEVHGARIVRGGVPIHGKTSEIAHDNSTLFAGLPSPFEATRYHSLIVEENSLSSSLRVTARSSDGVIMALEDVDRPHYGLQFHPESYLSSNGREILARFLTRAGIGVGPEWTVKKMNHRRVLEDILAGKVLEPERMQDFFGDMMDGKVPESVMAGFLVALRARGEDASELAAAARAMRQRVIRVPISRVDEAVDTCGTGGDGADTINISTASACVVAAAGVPVAKHGNRSVSSSCGSADVLEALGVALELESDQLARLCDEVGLSFLFAPRLHPAMRSVMPVRRAMRIRTIFNLLGPLCNPAGVQRQLVGVWNERVQNLVAHALAELGAVHALVVHSGDGLDEFSVFAPTRVLEIRDGRLEEEWVFDPSSLGLGRGDAAALAGGGVKFSARRMREVLGGQEVSAASEAVALNAAGAMVAADVVGDLPEAYARASEVLRSGAALDKLEALVAASRRVVADV